MAGRVETGLDYAIFQDHGYRGLYGGRTRRIEGEHGEKVLDDGVELFCAPVGSGFGGVAH